MATTKKKAAALTVPVPRMQAEAEQLLGDIGRLQREVAGIELRMNDALAGIRATAEQEAQPLNEGIETKFEALHAWAEAHRDELLKPGSKTAHLATGDLSWRVSPPSVSLRKTDKVIEALKSLGLTRFIRTKEEVAKDLILAERAAVEGVKGISITQKEEFVAKPHASEIEKVEPAKTTVR